MLDALVSPDLLRQQALIGGEWVSAASGRTFETIDPATARPITSVAHGEATDVDRAVREMRSNSHFHSMIRSSCAHLMEFLDEVGLLTKPAMRYYRKAHML